MHTVTTNDNTRLYVKDWGEGSPIILIHGWPLSADSWDAQAMALAQAGHRVIAYDRRGFGRSGQPWEGYDYDTLADDLSAVIQQTGLQDVTLVGFSMGGGEVARYMSRHGGRSVSKAALVSSVLPFRLRTSDNPSGTEQAVFDKTERALIADRAKFFTGFFDTFFGAAQNGHMISGELLEWARSVAMQASLKATIASLKSFSSTDFRGDLAAFNIPTLIVHGTADKTVPIDQSSRLAARGIEHSTLIEYDGAPHGLFVTDQGRLTKDLLAFMAW
ncbi:alpha/beta fold hydrolase [Paracandidimonas soli]|uniref:Pimeloyl-ACP methyl ester carboxylesterase n=2 Tax=Paracandidimonas soli TaxID=1917182 RepID=A0A4R3V538_9BURK|nr:alpha/beta hydrolase [Paracandidimonas soli]TCU98910.1 pimeloyl-ACP methyl ester carboxylesterase [Paracandidimonas soli]